MILDFNFKGKYVVIVGGGAEAYRKLVSFRDAGSKILIASRQFLDDIHVLHQQNQIDLLQTSITDARSFIKNLSKSLDVLVAVTDNPELNLALVRHAKTAGCLVYCADNPEASDFMFPAVAKIGDVKIAVFTSGKSPAMARLLRHRIEKIVTDADLLQIDLQAHIRPVLKQRFSDQRLRKLVLSDILEDNQIKRLLAKGKLEDAKRFALDIAGSYENKNTAPQE